MESYNFRKHAISREGTASKNPEETRRKKSDAAKAAGIRPPSNLGKKHLPETKENHARTRSAEVMPHRMSIVGVSGQAGSGKDTVADHLCSHHGFVKVALADPIKRFGYHVFLFTEQQLWGPSAFRNDVDRRFSSQDVWDECYARLCVHGKEYVQSTLGTDDSDQTDAAFGALIRWFHWLNATYKDTLSPRVMLQALGTEWGRDAVGPDTWINHMIRTAKTLLHEDGGTRKLAYNALDGLVDVSMLRLVYKPIRGVTVSDIRFKNEFDAIHNVGGVVIRVIRPDTDAKAATLGIAGHASEAQDFTMDDFDFICQNDSSIVDLFDSVNQYVEIFKLQHRG